MWTPVLNLFFPRLLVISMLHSNQWELYDFYLTWILSRIILSITPSSGSSFLPHYHETVLLYVLFFFCLNIFFLCFPFWAPLLQLPTLDVLPKAHSQLPSLHIIIFTFSLDDLIHIHGFENDAYTHISPVCSPIFDPWFLIWPLSGDIIVFSV